MDHTGDPRPKVGRTLGESTAAFRQHPQAGPDAPNVVMVVIDDLGFGSLGCYGSPINTPNIDALAEGGLRYNNFHVTSLCAPSRASILTGRNHHAVGMGYLADNPMGFPGYTAEIPPSAGTLPQVLKGAGYNTFAVGKWHLTPPSEQGASGPFDRWPLGLGFERYYGFLRGMANQWTPHLVSDNGYIEQPTSPLDGYHLTEDLAARAIGYMQDQTQQNPDKPFFLYFATGAMHVPYQVPPEWIEPYEHQFDGGWEAFRRQTYEQQLADGVIPPGTQLTERPSWVQPWDDLDADEQRLFARQMEVYAGFLSHTDAQIGKLIDFLTSAGLADNTIVIVTSDNGADGHSGPEGFFDLSTTNDVDSMLVNIDETGGHASFSGFAWGWAWAGNTPFKLWKAYTWLGGVRVPLVVQWPAGLAGSPEIRSHFCHAIDLMPTLLDLADVQAPDTINGVAQQRIDGESLGATLTDAAAEAPRSTQYFEMGGSRSIYHNGWKATTDHLRESNVLAGMEGSINFDTDTWSLYNLAEDYSEHHDLAAAEPDRLNKLIELWWFEAGRNNVLPLTDELVRTEGAPPTRIQTTYDVRPGGQPVAIPLVAGFDATASFEIPAQTEGSGIVCAQGGIHGGWACYFADGHLNVVMSFGGAIKTVRSPQLVPPGSHTVRIVYTPSDGEQGRGTVSLDNTEIGVTEVDDNPVKLAFLSRFERLHIGRDTCFPITSDYRPPFVFNGRIDRVVVELPDTSLSSSGVDRNANANLAANAIGTRRERRDRSSI